MGVSGQLHALAALSLGEEILLPPNMQWAAWATKPVWNALEKRKISLPLLGIEP